ncbi:unnamed protein product, partial [Polarella glacialis]
TDDTMDIPWAAALRAASERLAGAGQTPQTTLKAPEALPEEPGAASANAGKHPVGKSVWRPAIVMCPPVHHPPSDSAIPDPDDEDKVSWPSEAPLERRDWEKLVAEVCSAVKEELLRGRRALTEELSAQNE